MSWVSHLHVCLYSAGLVTASAVAERSRVTMTYDHVTPGGVEVAGEEMVSSKAAAGDPEGPWRPGAGEWGLTGNGICCLWFLVRGGP